jgi:hypothetical protein
MFGGVVMNLFIVPPSIPERTLFVTFLATKFPARTTASPS